MIIERIAAFSINDAGGNPAGVMITGRTQLLAEMQRIAAEIGYPETAFLDPKGGGWRVRYFAPKMEVPFCGHATIALGAALGARHGAGIYPLSLNDAEISVEAFEADGGWSAALTSPPTYELTADPALVDGVREVFGISDGDLSDDAPISRISAGADMIMIPLARRDRLARLDYDLAAGADLLNAHGIIGAYFVWRESDDLYHVRMAFPTGGILEDPATGAAAAALAGYLRDLHWPHGGAFTIHQGVDMGVPSRIDVRLSDTPGSAIEVSGDVRTIVSGDVRTIV